MFLQMLYFYSNTVFKNSFQKQFVLCVRFCNYNYRCFDFAACSAIFCFFNQFAKCNVFFFCEFWIDAACNAVFIDLIFNLYCAQMIKIKVKSNNMWQCCFADFFIQSSFTEINASDLLAGYCRSAVDVSYSFLL